MVLKQRAAEKARNDWWWPPHFTILMKRISKANRSPFASLYLAGFQVDAGGMRVLHCLRRLPPIKQLQIRMVISALVICAGLPSVRAQGTVIFNTNVPGLVNARVFCPDGATFPGPGVSAQLWGGPLFSELHPLEPVTTFGTGDWAGYVVPPSQPVVVPGVPEGGTAFLQLRAWNNFEGNLTWETAGVRGESNIIAVGPLGGESLPPAYLIGLESFQPVGEFFCIPEPRWLSFLALSLGCAIFLSRKR
jgi:hypothetical protein